MVFAASSVLVKCRLQHPPSSWELSGGGPVELGLCFLDAGSLGVCWWAAWLGGAARRRWDTGQAGFCWTKGSTQGEADLMCFAERVPGCPPAGWSCPPPKKKKFRALALVMACWAQRCLCVCHLCAPWSSSLLNSQDQSPHPPPRHKPSFVQFSC